MGPKALKSMWEHVCKQHNLTKDMYYVSYEYMADEDSDISKLEDIFDGSILICDEAHNLIPMLDDLHESASQILENIKNPALSADVKRRLESDNEYTRCTSFSHIGSYKRISCKRTIIYTSS